MVKTPLDAKKKLRPTLCVCCGSAFDEDGDCEYGCHNKYKGGMPENAHRQEYKNDYTDNFVEIFLSLSLALQNAGGRVKSLGELKSMSAYELICLLAPNKIRFSLKSEDFKA